MAKEFEDILTLIGGYGPYQKWLTFLLVVYVSYVGGIYPYIFITQVPPYWCHVPGREYTNYTQEEWIELTIPRTANGTLEKCSHYDVQFVEGSMLVNESDIRECSKWDHDTSQFQETLATSKEWFCEKELYSSHLMSAHMAGTAFGTPLLTILSDKIAGRRILFFVSVVVSIAFTIPILFLEDFGAIIAVKFIGSLGFALIYQLPFLVALELSKPSKRGMISFLLFLPWAFGMCTMALIAFLIPHWWYLLLINNILLGTLLLLWWFYPESPRWLILRNRFDESAAIMMKIARYNGVKGVSEEGLLKELQTITVEEKRNEDFRDLIHYPKLLIEVLNLSIVWAFSYVCYMAVALNINVLPDNVFLASFLITLSEVPANVIGWASCQYLGRRFTGVVCAFLMIPITIAAAMKYDSTPSLMITLMVVLKCLDTALLFALYLSTPEIFPTPIRSSALGFLSFIGMVAVSVSPYALKIANGGFYWLTAAMSVIMFVSYIFIPETIGLPLSQTYNEAQNHLSSRPFWKWVNHWNKDQYIPLPQNPPKEELITEKKFT